MTGPFPHPHWQDDDAEGIVVPLAPLIDIVFLLLVFFLVATAFKDEERDLALSMPRAEAGKSEEEGRLERIIVNIRSDGTLMLGRKPVGRSDLYRALVEARRANPYVPVILRGDKSTSHGEIVGVLSLCQKAKIRRVAVAVKPPEEAGEAAGDKGPE